MSARAWSGAEITYGGISGTKAVDLPCRHQNYEPVESAVTGERLATICTDCFDQLPADYSGEVWIVSTWDGRVTRYLPA